METPVPSAAPGASPHPARLALLLGGLAMFGALSIDTIFPAFPQIGAQFGADTLAMQQTISAYLATYALMSLVHGPLSDAVGRRRVILWGIALFALSSAGCAMATSLPMLIGFRLLQGLTAGVGLIVGRAVIRDLFDGEHAQRLMSQVSMVFGLAPAIAPIIGGWLLGWSRWPAIFWFLVLFAVMLWIAVRWLLPETHPAGKRLPLQPAALAGRYAEIARSGRFRLLAFAAAFNFGALFLYIASAPAFVLGHLHMDTRSFPWFFIPVISGMMLGAFTSGRMAGRVDGAHQVAIGFGCCLAAGACNIGYAWLSPQPQLPWAVLPIMLVAFGIGLVSPIVNLMNLDLFPWQRGGASSVQAFISLVSNALIAGVWSPLVSGSTLELACGSALFTLLGWICWRLDRRRFHAERVPAGIPDAPALEPMDEL